MAKRKRRLKRTRKPRGTTGLRPGEKMSEYPRTTVRLPPDVRELLDHTAAREGRQQWRVLVDAIRLYANARVPD